MNRLLPLALLVGCAGPDVAPTLLIRSPGPETELAGYATVNAVFAVEDDRNDPVSIEFFVDDGDTMTVTGDDCARGCTITASIPGTDLEDGMHTLTATVTDAGGQSSETIGPVEFFVHDIPFVSSIAVLDSQEGGLNGPNLEVEVHLLDDDTAQWLGCAPLEEVQQDDVQYDGLAVPFIANESGALVHFLDIGFEVVRVVVIESDNDEHCPIWPALTETLESDVDDLYGISPPIDLSLLFSGPIHPSVANVTGLTIERGRPFGVPVE
ncbi:MAG: hypothetical protein R3F61_12695 [Myxococcota bacterium]